MTVHLHDARVVILDIEGTTTPVRFVYDVLFPYARAHVATYLQREQHSGPCRAAVALLREELDASVAAQNVGAAETGTARALRPAVDSAAIVGFVHRLMDLDRKSRGLKMLQGLIWQDGYQSGEIRGEVFDDVAPALERWQTGGLRVHIYSSGSVLAQQLLFRTSKAGDLTKFLTGYFDTAVGPKTSPDSYRAIVEKAGVAAAQTLFVSDVAGELDAARSAGLRTALCERGAASGQAGAHPVIQTFDEIAD